MEESSMRYEHVTTTCPYCACGCGLGLQVIGGRIAGVLPSKTSPTNKGKLCIKGWNIHEFVQHPDRLKTPLIREGNTFREISWDKALGRAAGELRRIRDTYGPDSIGFLTSARCTNEENYLMQKFARTAIGTNNVDHCARL
jgi:predicted molibdopterin-dependent oxidoreductase YjgC